MSTVTIPISPDRNGDVLTALSPWLGRERAKPVPLHPHDFNGAWDVFGQTLHESSDRFAKFGIAGLANLTIGVSSTTFAWHAMVGVNRVYGRGEATKDTVITGTFWGMGVRALITAGKDAVEADTSLSVLAAKAEYESVAAQYQVQGIGLGPSYLADVLRKLPLFGKFDLPAHIALNRLRSDLVERFRVSLSHQPSALAQLQPCVVTMTSDRALFMSDLSEASNYRFCMRMIAAGLSWEEALENSSLSRQRPDELAEVEKLYAALSGVTGGAKPPPQNINAARDWLHVPI